MFKYQLFDMNYDSEMKKLKLLFEITDFLEVINKFTLKVYFHNDVIEFNNSINQRDNTVLFEIPVDNYLEQDKKRITLKFLLFSNEIFSRELGKVATEGDESNEKIITFTTENSTYIAYGTTKKFLLHRTKKQLGIESQKLEYLLLDNNEEIQYSNKLSLLIKFSQMEETLKSAHLKHEKTGLKIVSEKVRKNMDGSYLINFNFENNDIISEGYWVLYAELNSNESKVVNKVVNIDRISQFSEINNNFLNQTPTMLEIKNELYKLFPHRTREFNYGFKFVKSRVNGSIHQIVKGESELYVDYMIDSLVLKNMTPVKIEIFNEFIKQEIPLVMNKKYQLTNETILSFSIGQAIVEEIRSSNMIGKSFGLNLCLVDKKSNQSLKLRLDSLIDVNSANLYPKKEYFIGGEEHTLGIGIKKNGDIFLYTKILNNILSNNLSIRNGIFKFSIRTEQLNNDEFASSLKSINVHVGNEKFQSDFIYDDNIINIKIDFKKKIIDKDKFNDLNASRLILEFCNESHQSIYKNIKVESLHQLPTSFKAGIFNSESDGAKFSIFVDSKQKDVCIEKRKLKEIEKPLYKVKFYIAKLLAKVSNIIVPEKKVWLIGENLGEVAQDNGFAFFEYCINDKKRSNTYYVTKANNKNMNQLFPYKDNLVYYDTFTHMYLYHKTKYAIVAHGLRDVIPSYMHNKFNRNPLPVIYLQHGIIAMKRLFFKKNSYNNQIKRFIVSSDHEKDIMIDEMGFDEQQIAVTGLARYDKLYDISSENTKERIIFVMPTWREWLLNDRELFTNSSFYKNYIDLLTNTRLNEILKENSTKLLFLPHFEIQKNYMDLFDIDTQSNIALINPSEISVGEMIRKSNALITDYSSVAFDYAYLNKPVLFFHFDLNDYLYKRGSYIDLQDELFGQSYNSVETLVGGIEECIKKEFHISEMNKLKTEKYIAYKDKDNSKRIFESIMSLVDC